MLKNHLKRVFIGLIIGLIGGVLYWRLAPKVYDALAVVYINTDSSTFTKDQSANEVEKLIGIGNTQNVISEVDMLRAEQTFKEALSTVAANDLVQDLASQDTEQKLFPMYDVEANKDSHVCTVDVKAFDQKYANDIANEVVDVYNRSRKSNQEKAYKEAVDYLTTSIGTTKTQLDQIENKLTAFKQSHVLLEPTQDESALASNRSKLSSDLASAQMEQTILTKQVEMDKKVLASRPKTQIMSTGEEKNPTLTNDESKLSQLEQERAALLVKYTPDSDKVRDINRTITAFEKVYAKDKLEKPFNEVSHTRQLDTVAHQLDTELATAEVSKAALASRISALQQQLDKNTAAEKAYPGEEMAETNLLRDRETFNGQYVKLKHELQDVLDKQNMDTLPANLAYAAAGTGIPVSPLAAKAIPTGAALGACLFLLLSLALEALRSTVRTSSELTGVLGLPVTATVPALKPREAQRRMRTLAEPTFVPLESFRFMASAAALTVDGTHRVLFTGIGGNVGCSTSAAEFAVASAKMGVKTILVDADLAAATASKAFGVSGKPGIRDIINHTLLPAGEGTLLQPTEHKNLSILPAGSAEGLGISDVPSSQLAAVLESLAPLAQLIIIDCPPFDVLADASRFVPYVDEACLVVSAKKTHLQSIMVVEKLIQRAGAHTVSIVLTETGTPEEAFSKRGYRYRRAS